MRILIALLTFEVKGIELVAFIGWMTRVKSSPSERYQSRPSNARRTTSNRFFDYDALPSGTHGSYMTRMPTNDTNLSSQSKPQKQLLKDPTNIEANPSGLIVPDDEESSKISAPSRIRQWATFSKPLTLNYILGIVGAMCLGGSFLTTAYLTGRTNRNDRGSRCILWWRC